MTDVTAVARAMAKNAAVQYGLACVYTDSRGWKISTYCHPPRKTRDGELEYFDVHGQSRSTIIRAPMLDLAVDPAAGDEIEIAESVSAQHCGTYRAQHVVPDDEKAEALLVVHKP